MSTVSIPTKPSGIRPPIPPEKVTGFSPFGDDSDQPLYQLIWESVERILRLAERSDVSQLFLVRGLLVSRKQMVENELRYERMFTDDQLPPLLMDLYSLGFPEFDEAPVPIYLKLIRRLDDAIWEVDERLSALNASIDPSHN